jgi:Holliday junction resolvase RusA-like endonuclease
MKISNLEILKNLDSSVIFVLRAISMSLQDDIEVLLKKHGITRDNLRGEIVNLYNLLNSASLNPESTSLEQEEEIVRWLNNNGVHFISLRKEPYNKRDWFVNEIDKHSYLSQFHCKICDVEGLRIFPIRIPPQSRQTKTLLKNKFQELISTAPFTQNGRFDLADRICLKVIFVINKGRDKDLDNMVKTTLDGLKKVLFPDDKQIDHLELIKFKTQFVEEFISISIGKSNLNNSNNVLFKGENLGWAGLETMKV